MMASNEALGVLIAGSLLVGGMLFYFLLSLYVGLRNSPKGSMGKSSNERPYVSLYTCSKCGTRKIYRLVWVGKFFARRYYCPECE